MKTIRPFENESESLAVADLTIENRTDRVQIYGTAHITRDKAGLANARLLKAVVDAIVEALERDRDLPDAITLTNQPRPMKNPFGR
jgi:hypothetical protein